MLHGINQHDKDSVLFMVFQECLLQHHDLFENQARIRKDAKYRFKISRDATIGFSKHLKESLNPESAQFLEDLYDQVYEMTTNLLNLTPEQFNQVKEYIKLQKQSNGSSVSVPSVGRTLSEREKEGVHATTAELH